MNLGELVYYIGTLTLFYGERCLLERRIFASVYLCSLCIMLENYLMWQEVGSAFGAGEKI